ncbi:MAG: glycosyltransferase family 2 protein [Enterobacterales bacterium]|jgi:glycosyltransferase involved in cell wall biosynthesis
MQELVSIIMPSYNAERFIEESINSVLSQTYQNWELLITDDVSKDNTVAIVKQYAINEPRIRLVEKSNNDGAGVARNDSILRAKGRYIAFLDSDDLWVHEKLSKQISFMQNNNVPFSYTGYQKFTGDKKLLGEIIPPAEITYNELLNSNVIGCLTAIYDCQAIGKQYMPTIRKRQDMALWLHILKLTPKAVGLQESLAHYRVDVGMSSNKAEMLKWQWRLYREVEQLSVIKSLKHFVIYALKGYLKYKK